ncbi:MAG: molybdopterin-dependent oxidoreductase [Methylobacterium sp.]|uniref:sulfite oxidase n=1 Tax=Methylobacterium sp. TaxID=409 RepID=UPI0025FE7C38|nr:molybdopterin-dependent oxidoreductase [Methylobacterium sp.]MBX9933040.1 molybdopterin-dependent oxidoreductase [Methylobacterium sp.]
MNTQGRIERSLDELYSDDHERADALLHGRRTGASRRGFLNGAGLAAMSATVGAAIPFAGDMPAGLLPAAHAQGAPPVPAPATKGPQPLDFPGKDKGLVVLGDRPLVAETPEHLLDEETTPLSKFFIRTNGLIPEPAGDAESWKFLVDGEVNQRLELSLGELKARFTPKTYRMVLECGGNGRSFFQPQARGNPWTNGGAGCAEWTGVPLDDVLKAAGLKDTAKYTAHYGADPHLSGDAKKDSLSRGMPIAKAMEEHGLVVFAMNGEPLPNIHGGPVRLVVPGWPASLSHKWLTRITIRDREHDGQGMTGTSYRVPNKPMVPGGKADEADFRILESMPVRSIVTSPANGARLPAGSRAVAMRGAAWAGDLTVSRVDVSIDFGATWIPTQLAPTRNRYDWSRWSVSVPLPSDGYYELWVRATDSAGKAQPHVAANWNPQGYGGNALHRVAVLVG